MAKHSILVLDADDVEEALSPRACLEALRAAYRDLDAARDDAPRALGFAAEGGKFHVKAGLLPGSRRYFAAKTNANFPGNPQKKLPTVQGLVTLFDGADGLPLALLHSGAITGLRTAAAPALAAEHCARPSASRLSIIGAGAQARYQLAAMADAFPLRALVVFDVDVAKAEALARLGRDLGLDVRLAHSVADALSDCDIATTLTTSAKPIVTADMLHAGVFLAALGADSPGKQEIDQGVFAIARVFCDDIEQCAAGGDLAAAIRAGTSTAESVAGDLAMLAAGKVPGRRSPDDVVLYDSTGSGVQDVAAAAAAYEAAEQIGVGTRLDWR